MHPLTSGFWRGRRVLVTGHMGFKGAWLTYLLSRLGADVTGYGRDGRSPLLYRTLPASSHQHREGDVKDGAGLSAALAEAQPEVVIHMAAQPLVLASYADPRGTFDDNVMGTVSLLDALRRASSVRAAVVVTSDKVYRNEEWVWAYRENEPLGGSDPYSASKAAAEIVTQSMVASYFSKPGTARVATARAGNVIGGGDWAEARLLPDAARALSRGDSLTVRNPRSTRPWQHVLEPLGGYLALAQALAEGRDGRRPAWNFGPAHEDALPVSEIADLFVSAWGRGAAWRLAEAEADAPKEAHFLAVDTALARRELGWQPRWRVAEAVARTANWYRNAAEGADCAALLDRDIDAFLSPEGRGL